MAYQDKFVEVDGLKLRYIEEGSGPSLLFLHGASLGSSADVFLRNLGPFAKAGFRAVAFDLPGFGLSDIPAKQSVGQQRNSIPKFIDAAGLGKTALIAHSRSGGFAMQLALEDPSRYSHLIILGTGSLLPLQTEAQVGRYEAVQARVDKEMAQTEPTLEDARKLLQADTFNHALISEEDVAVRHSRMIGRNFKAHQERQNHEAPAGGAAPAKPAKPLWERLSELKMPLLMIFGREDRAHAGERAELLKQQQPQINLHIVNGCKHMVHWDAFDDLMRLGVPFLKS
ncbi:MAG: 4,5:9,10-diseco-3-hydroxy-5,9,17-trioxoandrosta(10),2-diene-4-oate hydrolase [Candidatus Binatota bacterium]|nr:4,5:9,10-diseco-3-hydroxy-5,9,17-trioxoandrosta(10),2-diene-4-oate hydrolase [Candidatus Binatota bacterium]